MNDTVKIHPRPNYKRNEALLIDTKHPYAIKNDSLNSNDPNTIISALLYRISIPRYNLDQKSIFSYFTDQTMKKRSKGKQYIVDTYYKQIELLRKHFIEFVLVKIIPGYKMIDYKTKEEWLENNSKYTLIQKQKYLDKYHNFDFQYKEYRKSFGKKQDVDVGSTIRMIAGCDDNLKIMFRNYYYSLEEYIFHTVHTIKKIAIKDRPKHVYSQLIGYKRYGTTDFTSFESSIRFDIMEAIELELYRRVFPEDVFRYMQTNHRNFFTRCPHFTYKSSDGKRASGDGDTSLGNTLTNMTIITYCLITLGISDFNFIVEGDDCIFGYNSELTDEEVSNGIKILCLGLGLKIKVEIKYSLETTPFLSAYYQPNKSWWSNPKMALGSMTTSRGAFNDINNANSYFQSKYLSYSYENFNTPYIGVIAHELFEGVENFKFDTDINNSYYREVYKDIKEQIAEYKGPEDYDRVLYQETTGVDIYEQLCTEQDFSNIQFFNDMYIPHSCYYNFSTDGDKLSKLKEIEKIDTLTRNKIMQLISRPHTYAKAKSNYNQKYKNY